MVYIINIHLLGHFRSEIIVLLRWNHEIFLFVGPLFGFTKSNELFVGRLAQLGIAFSLIGEIITGKGALAQLNIETGIPISDIEPLVLFNVAFFFVAALNPGTGKFVTDDEED